MLGRWREREFGGGGVDEEMTVVVSKMEAATMVERR